MKAPIALPHIDVLKDYFELDPSIPEGVRWKKKASRNTVIGSPAGRRHLNGYWEIRFQKILYKSSRLIYKLYNNGEDPGLFEIDHLDRNKDNNAGYNLILANKRDQQSNQEVKSMAGYRNVCLDKRLRRSSAPWMSIVSHRIDGKKKCKFLGYFSNPYEASIAAISYKKEIGMRYEYAPGGTV